MMHNQLTSEVRYTISRLRMTGHSVTSTGEILGRHRSTIHREIQRNSVVQCGRWTYSPRKAQKKRNRRSRWTRRGRQYADWQYSRVQTLLRQQWSPQQVAGTPKKQGEFAISFQTIYRHVRRDWKSGGQLWRELRHRYKRRKRHYGLERRGRLRGKRMIDERPAHVETRQQAGHWEIDTVKGAGWEKPCIVTLVERVSGYVLIGKLPNGTTVYFARPHHPWERGSNENTNGLIRQYSPKGVSMAGLTQRQCDAIAHKLNTRPRKRYGYDRPKQRLRNC